MLQFGKDNAGDTTKSILASRGDERLDDLARYIAFQDKKKKSKHSISLSNVEERGAHTDVVPMCEFQLRKEILATENRRMAEVWCAAILW